MWQADQTPLDLRVVDERGRHGRPWFTVVLDDYSRAAAGYALSLYAPSSIQTALAPRQAIWRKGDPHWSVCGIPETFYNDDGSDSTSHHLEQVVAELKTAHIVFSTAGKLRGRGKVERMFGTVNQLFLCHQPGYTPAGSGFVDAFTHISEHNARLEDLAIRWIVNHHHHQVRLTVAIQIGDGNSTAIVLNREPVWNDSKIGMYHITPRQVTRALRLAPQCRRDRLTGRSRTP
ncbi:MAG: transposase family protein [Chloroflexota bacterium]|nr:transposase family protein [Chloroflexota bacterium]